MKYLSALKYFESKFKKIKKFCVDAFFFSPYALLDSDQARLNCYIRDPPFCEIPDPPFCHTAIPRRFYRLLALDFVTIRKVNLLITSLLSLTRDVLIIEPSLKSLPYFSDFLSKKISVTRNRVLTPEWTLDRDLCLGN